MTHADKVPGWDQQTVLNELADDATRLSARESTDAAQEAAIVALQQAPPGATNWLLVGLLPLDSFTGSDDDKMGSALTYIGQQTYKPTLVLANRAHSFSRTYPLNIDGLRVHGPVGGMAREFRNNTAVSCPPAGLFAVDGAHKDFLIEGLTFTGTGQFIATTASILSDCDIIACGFVGFSSVYSGKILRCNFDRWYVNTASDTQLSVGGSDSSLFMSGNSFMSGATMKAGQPFIRLGSLSQSRIGAMYCTPTNGYGLNIDQGADAEGLEFFGWRQTAYGQSGATAPKGAGIRIRNGQAVTFHGGVLFNANTDGTAKGDIECWGGTDHVFEDFQFVGTHEGFTSVNLTAPAIWTQVPIVVRSPRSVGGRPKVLGQSAPGLITLSDAPGWSIVTAA